MRGPRIVAALAVALALVPVAAAKPPPQLGFEAPPAFRAYRAFHVLFRAPVKTRKDRERGCQVSGDRSRARVPGQRTVGERARRASTVACEQPPRVRIGPALDLKQLLVRALALLGGP